jgi:hypothetical protein
LKSHIILSPSVKDRFGAQWHKYPVLTNDFEAKFTVIIRGDQSTDKIDQGFAFWCVKENITQTIPENLAYLATDVTTTMKSLGWGLFGSKEMFEGFGLVFAYHRRASTGELEFKPSVSLVTNDGTRVITSSQIPTAQGSFWNFRSFSKLDVKVRVKADSVLVEAKPSGAATWTRLIDVPSDQRKFAAKPGSFIGFTSHVGTAGSSQAATADEIIIDQLELENMDLAQVGEETLAAQAPASLSQEDVLLEQGAVGESRALRALSRAVFRVVTETEPTRRSLAAAVRTLASRIDGIELAIQKLKDEVMLASGHDMDKDFAEMKEKLMQISRDAALGSQQKRDKLGDLHKDLDSRGRHQSQVVDELAQRAQDLMKTASASSSWLFVLVGAGSLLVLLAGVVMVLKFTSWEKKHLL